jgi:hypothetical protein
MGVRMKEKINYDVDIDSSRLLYKLKQVVDEYQDIDRKIISTENFIENYVPVDYREKDNEVYIVTDSTIEGQQKILDRYKKRKIKLRFELDKISSILEELLSDNW